jgi:DNA-methyltransferase (dcm)
MALRIGTDCSGIEAPVQALKQLKIPFRHVWSCEIDEYARQSIEANYEPENMYTDITKRNYKTLPDIDVYVAGFPCQCWSNLGKKLGTKDKRSNIVFHCIETIQRKQPKIFILENVKNLVYVQEGKVFEQVLEFLNDIGTYNIYHHVYNTSDYGLPQNRERLYIVGIRKDAETTPFTVPKKQKMSPLDNYLDDEYGKGKPCPSVSKYIEDIQEKYGKRASSQNFCIACAGFGNFMYEMTPTLTSSRYYLTKYKRYLYPHEKLRLQGFPKTFKQVVSDSQFNKQAGNTMSVNVVKAIMKQCLKSIE